MRKTYRILLEGVPNLKLIIDTDRNEMIFSGNRTKKSYTGLGALFNKYYYNFNIGIYSSNEPAIYADGKYGYSLYVGGDTFNPPNFTVSRDIEFDHYPKDKIIKYFNRLLKFEVKLNKQLQVL